MALVVAAERPLAAASPAKVTAPQAAQAPKNGRPPAQYVGTDTCLGCHEDMTKGLADTPHWKKAHPNSPAANMGCESCHGPGSRHIEDPTDDTTIIKFSKVSPREASAQCLTCHTKATHALWDGSTHDARKLACTTCHSVHAPKSATYQLKAATELELCGTCHKQEASKVKRLSHMPVQEGKMACTSCHNPHGSTNVRLLAVGNWINESCVACHAEKRGPFLFEHAAGRESCVSCHDPHGSSNEKMLVAKLPMLCQRCHIGSRHPSTIYDMAAVSANSNRIIGRGCVNCHQNIHGSNHPSGQTLTR
jgi:DmsE family decaheme c-type cytochrome